MHAALLSHPDRAAATLATVAAERAARGDGPFLPPEPGARDCRIDLKILAWHARRASIASPAAQARLAAFDPQERPDLWAGTLRDGTARGFAVALEEAIALAPAPHRPDELEAEAEAAAADPTRRRVLEGKQLRRTKDILVSSGGPRVRFSRREGLLYVDRGREIHSANCLRFEARRDLGTLDAFEGDEAERPRLFSAQFLRPVRYETSPGFAELLLAGRIGRGPVGWDAELSITGRESEGTLRLELRLDNAASDWRLRARFLGIAPDCLAHECDDVREVVENDAGGFVAFTLVRACGRLLVDGKPVAVPGAQCHGRLVHVFRLGPA